MNDSTPSEWQGTSLHLTKALLEVLENVVYSTARAHRQKVVDVDDHEGCELPAWIHVGEVHVVVETPEPYLTKGSGLETQLSSPLLAVLEPHSLQEGRRDVEGLQDPVQVLGRDGDTQPVRQGRGNL